MSLLHTLNKGGPEASFAAWGANALLTQTAAAGLPGEFSSLLETFRNGQPTAGEEPVLLADAGGGTASDAGDGLLLAAAKTKGKQPAAPAKGQGKQPTPATGNGKNTPEALYAKALGGDANARTALESSAQNTPGDRELRKKADAAKAVGQVMQKYNAMTDNKRDMEALDKDLQTAINGIPGLNDKEKADLRGKVEKDFGKQFQSWSYSSRMAHRGAHYEAKKKEFSAEMMKKENLTEEQVFADVDGFMDTEYRKARWDPSKDDWKEAKPEKRTHYPERSRILGEQAERFADTPEGRRKIADERATFGALRNDKKWKEELSAYRLYHLDLEVCWKKRTP